MEIHQGNPSHHPIHVQGKLNQRLKSIGQVKPIINPPTVIEYMPTLLPPGIPLDILEDARISGDAPPTILDSLRGISEGAVGLVWLFLNSVHAGGF